MLVQELEALLARYRPLATRIARGYTASEADADDIVQEALLAVAAHLAELREPDAFQFWFARVVHNAARQWLRRARRRLLEQPLEAGGEALGDPQAPRPWVTAGLYDPASGADFELAEARDVLRRLLRTLPGRERELLERAYLDDEPYQQIARRMGLSQRGVDSLLYRTLRRVRTVATQCGELEELTLWCPSCGRHRLLARLEPGHGPAWPIRIRVTCPGCTPGGGRWADVGLPLAHYAALETALLGGLAALGAELRQVVRDPRCPACAGPLSVESDTRGPGWRSWVCPRCSIGGSAGPQSVAAAVPEWRAFWQATPRLRLEPTARIERDGETQLVLRARDDATGHTITLGLSAGTLEPRWVARRPERATGRERSVR